MKKNFYYIVNIILSAIFTIILIYANCYKPIAIIFGVVCGISMTISIELIIKEIKKL